MCADHANQDLKHVNRVIGPHLGQVEQEGIAGEVEKIGSSLADADVAQNA